MNRRSLLGLAGAGLGLSACYTLTKRDIFEVAFDPISPATMAALSDASHELGPLPLEAAGRRISAYWDRGKASKGVLVFFDGNGYGAEAAARRMLIPTRALGLDLVVFNYLDRGESLPSMSQMRAVGEALCQAASGLPTDAARAVYAGGHSLGATFALDVAGGARLAGAFVAAPVTTGIDMLHHQLSYTRLALLTSDQDYRQFDNLTLARRVKSKTIVFGSNGDTALPPPFTNAVFEALPADIVKRKVILEGVPHSEYFARQAFWQALSDFFSLPANGPLVGYIPRRPT